MLFVIVSSVNLMIFCSVLSRVLVGCWILTGSNLRIYTVFKGVCGPETTFKSWCKMSLVPIIFLSSGWQLDYAVEQILFLRLVSRWDVMKLTCFTHINYFLSFLFLIGFISDVMQFKHFLWLRFEDHDFYMMNLYCRKEFAPLIQSARIECMLNKLFYLCYLSVQ